MSNQYKKLLWCALAVTTLGCSKVNEYKDIVSSDKTKPDPVTNVQVKNEAGAAIITYNLPRSENILYVQAEYMINGQTSRQTKSSYYSDTIHVGGFEKSQDYTVTLHTVSRANVQSDPVEVTVHPDTPPYLQAFPTIETKADFGGININVLNELKANLGIITITTDPVTRQHEIVNQHYTNGDTITYSVRGYDTIPREFGIYITDQWGNISDTLLTTVTPIYEEQMDKSKFNGYILGTDVETGFGWEIQNLWNGNTGSPGYHTEQPIQPLVWPAVITFDMGQAAKLSRYTIWNRGIDGSGNWLWQAGAPQTWTLWGRESDPVDETLPSGPGAPGVGETSANGWINLGTFTLPAKPSGLPNPQYTNADLDFWNAGFSFNFSLELPKVRYIRFQCLENASLTNNFFNIAELTFWGDPR
ncbi:DUF5000 domain-containing lipoprotein [Chitinophaga cymbidii]|uniref:DUF4959 domain-containing protein n=1 Tax=Chitinophaga cymbidii TaxID=1096750 RepID=A0A512RPG8_9BACT|nr:DUF5000 domain-containing lipoprotein [Chitinophaga cymbidii]GEP97593.1 hypothetical protein CCY01nite_38530 [Chitinophaga cymbidii]